MLERGEGVVLPALMDVKQVCEYLGLHRVTVVEFARLGKLPAFKVGREWRFRADEIREWMDRQRRNPAVDDRFERLWQRLGEPVRERRLDLEDIGDLIAEVRGERAGDPASSAAADYAGQGEEGTAEGQPQTLLRSESPSYEGQVDTRSASSGQADERGLRSTDASASPEAAAREERGQGEGVAGADAPAERGGESGEVRDADA